MKLLEEKGLRNKIINECIKMENELQKQLEKDFQDAEHDHYIPNKLNYYAKADKKIFAKISISDLRMNLMQLLDNEKVE